ncbi:uncharacterized protein [Argopecten irradians]|uniref:uncharacterized protein n=1 Tax=Argopecten irradians TaxID=31199 RepID=UPI0037173724
MAENMHPFRELLKPDQPFKWTEDLQRIFDESKIVIANEIKMGVLIFDPSKPTSLATNYSKSGIGFWLLQKHCTCTNDSSLCCRDGWKVTLVGSRFTHAAEMRYTPVEGEALAVADALDKVRHFVLGHPIGDTDKLVLEDDVATMFSSTTDFGVLHGLRTPSSGLAFVGEHVIAAAFTTLNAIDLRSVTWDRVKTATTSDDNMQALHALIESGMPNDRHELPKSLQEYFTLRDDLHTVDGVVLYKE